MQNALRPIPRRSLAAFLVNAIFPRNSLDTTIIVSTLSKATIANGPLVPLALVCESKSAVNGQSRGLTHGAPW